MDTNGYIKKIEEFLSYYKDGKDVFKRAHREQNWDWEPELVEGKTTSFNLPRSWIGIVEHVIGIIAHEKYGLDTYPNQIEIINADFMMDAYTRGGMPIFYDHWSFGMERENLEKAYRRGQMGLAYEIVINTKPAIAYCMDENSPVMQMLVIAHASFGHNSFFKGNHLFRQFTQAEEIVPLLTRMKSFVADCERKYGIGEVETVLDACHALEAYAVNRYQKPPRRSPEEIEKRRLELEDERARAYDPVIDGSFKGRKPRAANKEFGNTAQDLAKDIEENILLYIADYAPHLSEWQRQILRMKGEVAQYFYPQGQTQVMNEGWATFWHYTLMNDLADLNLIDGGMYLEFISSHSNVLFQSGLENSNKFRGKYNPYKLGFEIFRDIQRISCEPTQEDRELYPLWAGRGDWLDRIKFAMQNFKDESFILQYLSPKVIRDFRLFVLSDDDEDYYEVQAVSDEDGYRTIRQFLAENFDRGAQQPTIEIADYNYKGNRSLTLRHMMHNNRPLNEESTAEVLKHIYQLWRHPVVLRSVDQDGVIQMELGCPPLAKVKDIQFKFTP